MFLRSLLDVLLARRWIVLTCLVSCLAGGAWVIIVSPPRYQATAKVILNYIKPDPVTGEFVNSRMADAYVNAQMQTIRDYQVAVPAAEAMGLLDNLDLQTAYAAIPGANPEDFPEWIAARIVASTGVRVIPETNIIEISFATNTPEGAREYVETIREAYVQSSIAERRKGAEGAAVKLQEQANAEAAALAKLEGAKRQLERVHGVMPAMEAERLSKLVTEVRSLYVEEAPTLPSANRLTQIETQLAEASKALGPNHPSLKALKAARDAVAIQAQQERLAAAQFGQGAAQAERARQAAIEVQKNKVLSERQVALELRLIDEEMERRREVYNGLGKRIAELRQMTSMSAVNLVPFGEIEGASSPAFPNPYLILGGSGFLGAVVGAMLALLVEFLGRRVRRPQHLADATHAPLLGVVPRLAPSGSGASAPRRRFGPMRRRTEAAA